MNARQEEILVENYASISSLVSSIASRISRRYVAVLSQTELHEELVGYGWLQVMLNMEGYDERRGCAVTTFLWERLRGRVARYAVRYVRFRLMDEVEAEVVPESSAQSDSEEWKNSLCVNPWINGPDQALECHEREKAKRILSECYTEGYEACLEGRAVDGKVRRRMSVNERQTKYRMRKRALEMFSTIVDRESNLLRADRTEVFTAAVRAGDAGAVRRSQQGYSVRRSSGCVHRAVSHGKDSSSTWQQVYRGTF